MVFFIQQLAESVGCFPRILAIFYNGVAYEFFQGRTLDGPDLNDDKVIRYEDWKGEIFGAAYKWGLA